MNLIKTQGNQVSILDKDAIAWQTKFFGTFFLKGEEAKKAVKIASLCIAGIAIVAFLKSLSK